MSGAEDFFSDWKFVVSVVGAGLLLITLLVGHALACYRCCRRRKVDPLKTKLPPSVTPRCDARSHPCPALLAAIALACTPARLADRKPQCGLSRSRCVTSTDVQAVVSRRRYVDPSTPLLEDDPSEEDGRKTPSINMEDPDESTPLVLGSPDPVSHVLLGADSYNVVAQRFLAWNLPLVVEGWGSPIHKSRIPPAKAKFASESVGRRMDALWSAEVQKEQKKPRLNRAVLRLIWRQLVLSSGIAMLVGVLSTVARPLILREIVNEIATGQVELDEAALLLVQLALVVFVEGWLAVRGPPFPLLRALLLRVPPLVIGGPTLGKPNS